LRRSDLTASAVAAVLVLIVAQACASGGAPGAATGGPDRVTTAEIDATAGASSAYDLVNRLRPHWLRTPIGSISPRGGSTQVILVYLDGIRLGGVSDLRMVSASSLGSMQYLDATRAPTVLRDIGTEPVAGAILLTTRR